MHESGARERANVLPGHRRLLRKSYAPRLNKRYPGGLNAAADALFPWQEPFDYPGFTIGLHKLFRGRASPHTIRDWRRGKRKAPAWARALLLEAVEKRIAALEHARALLNTG